MRPHNLMISLRSRHTQILKKNDASADVVSVVPVPKCLHECDRSEDTGFVVMKSLSDGECVGSRSVFCSLCDFALSA